MTCRLLIVDDSAAFLGLMKDFLQRADFLVDTAISGEQAIEKVRDRRNRYALVVLDYVMEGGKDGAETTQEILKLRPEQYIVIYSNDPSRDALKNSWRAGAVEFVDKGVPPEALLEIVKRWCAKYKETQLTITPPAPNQASKKIATVGLVGISPSMVNVADLVLKYRGEKSTVLILGESGTGKERIAQALHGDDRHPFRAVNCAAYNGDAALLESELFGIEQGAFTGAARDKKGVFEEVGRGTVFLDEIHTLSLKAQQKLLRALQEKTVRPVGSSREYPVHFRLVAAAKPSLEAMRERGEFLPDLWYRLHVLCIQVPPLRERLEDISPLVLHFAKAHAKPGHEPKEFLARTLRYLERYSWPGNVRELENTVERLCATVSAPRVTPEDLDAKFFAEEANRASGYSSVADLRKQYGEVTRDLVVNALDASRSQREAAKKLGIPYSTFFDLLKKYGLTAKAGAQAQGKTNGERAVNRRG